MHKVNKIKEFFKYEKTSIFGRGLLGLILLLWALALFAGGNLGVIKADGTYTVIGEALSGNQLIAWVFFLLALDNILPDKLSPFSIVERIILYVVKGLKNIIKSNWG